MPSWKSKWKNISKLESGQMTESDQLNRMLEAMMIRRRMLIKTQMEQLEKSLEELEHVQKNIDNIRKNKPLRFRKAKKESNESSNSCQKAGSAAVR